MTTNNLAWLDASFVEKILQNAENDKSIKVSSIIVKAATAKGDNYSSDMRRVAVTFSRVQDGHTIQEKKSLIVKSVLQGEMFEKLVEAIGSFRTELPMMSVTLPRMEKILEDVCPTSLGPRCLHVQYEKPIHVVMEDLETRDFRMAERRAGLDLDHCSLVIRNLGRFHAASIVLKEKDPKAFLQCGNKGVFHKDHPAELHQFIKLGSRSLANVIAKWPELSPRITKKVLKLPEVLIEKAGELALCREDDFNVLNHGDCWVNNMLFRYDEQGKPIEHIFVDFQLSQYGSPAIDLLYFIGSSPTNEIRIDHREILLREYHASLTKTMVALNGKTAIPTFDELQEILKNRAFYEVATALLMLPMVTLEEGEEIDTEKLLQQTSEFINPSFHGKLFRKVMTRLLPFYDSMGWLDV